MRRWLYRGAHRANQFRLTVADITAQLAAEKVPTGRTFAGLPVYRQDGQEWVMWTGQVRLPSDFDPTVAELTLTPSEDEIYDTAGSF